MTVHNPKTYQDLEKMDETKVYSDLNEKFCFAEKSDPSYPQAAFSHLMSGYNSGYYAYIWYELLPPCPCKTYACFGKPGTEKWILTFILFYLILAQMFLVKKYFRRILQPIRRVLRHGNGFGGSCCNLEAAEIRQNYWRNIWEELLPLQLC